MSIRVRIDLMNEDYSNRGSVAKDFPAKYLTKGRTYVLSDIQRMLDYITYEYLKPEDKIDE